MANLLKVAVVNAIVTLRQRGWSLRRIARELGIHRDTVARHVQLAQTKGAAGQNQPNPPAGSGPPKPAIAPLGSEASGLDAPTAKPANAPLGSQACADGISPAQPGDGPDGGPAFIALRPTADVDRLRSAAGEDRALLASNPSASAGPDGTGGIHPGAACTLPAARPGRGSDCEPFRSIILFQLEQGLSAQRIYQDLVAEHGFTGSYYSVRRFVRPLKASESLPFRRMECEPGAEVQVDFGKGATIVESNGRRRRPHLFRIVLSCSRKAYSEVVYRQTTENYLRCLENAFWHFGGVPVTAVIDNLKAAVQQADWYDPELNPKIQSFCEHYGIAILPTRPYTPRHKGKIERGVAYAQDNALKGRTFSSLAEQNRYLQEWEVHVADTRIHGTTHLQVGKVFTERERAALRPLPAGRFPSFSEGRRSVHRDAHVEVDKAYYSVPPEYLGREVWVRWDGHLVRIFNQRMEPIATHVQAELGRFSTQNAHIHSRKISGVERGSAWLLNKVSFIGSQTAGWAESMLQQRGIQGVRVLVGLLRLADQHAAESIEQACQTARSHGSYRLRAVRDLLDRQADQQEQFEFTQEDPIIRSLGEYEDLVKTAFTKEP
jgi:transposase